MCRSSKVKPYLQPESECGGWPPPTVGRARNPPEELSSSERLFSPNIESRLWCSEWCIGCGGGGGSELVGVDDCSDTRSCCSNVTWLW